MRERREAERAFAVARELGGTRRLVGVRGTPGQSRFADPPPRRPRAVGQGDLDRHVDGQQSAELLRERDDRLHGEPVLGVPTRLQPHRAAHRHVRVHRQHRQVVPAVGIPDPAHGRCLRLDRGPRDELDLVGHHERREQPDPELPEELLAAQPEVQVALRGPADGREQLPRLLGGQPDARVRDLEAAVLAWPQPHAPRCTRVVRTAGGDRVDAVLQQLAHVDARARVQVPREQVDDPAQVDLEGLTRRGGIRRAQARCSCSALAAAASCGYCSSRYSNSCRPVAMLQASCRSICWSVTPCS